MLLYNTLTRKKEEFIPITPGKVAMYVCGPTVYNFFHIGNARPFMMFDILRRYLEYRGLEVKYIQNFTDVDDKIINRANEDGVDSLFISEKYIEEYFKDADALGIKRATVHPKVTDTIPEIVAFIEVLIQKGYAYESAGDVYFDTTRFKTYGQLSKQSIEDLDAGARVEVSELKKHPIDFALWKACKPGEPFWESPWGKGRPGWHIECSVMSTKFLGETIDIHAGGADLVFPHHENEIAQSEAYSGKPYVNYWLHNGYINIDNEKMSKSKGNFFTVRDILVDYDPEVVRFFMVQAHYRSPVNFSRELIEAAANGLERLYNLKENLEHRKTVALNMDLSPEEAVLINELNQFKDKYIAAMENDLNTADAVAAIFELASSVNIHLKEERSEAYLTSAEALLSELCGVLGILGRHKASLDSDVEALIEARQAARGAKNWAESDRIRDLLKEQGVILEDTPQGVKWSRSK